MLAHIQAYQAAQGRLLSMLPALPKSLVRIEGSTDVGLIMAAMPGDTIGGLVGARRLPRYSLPIRLRLAACLALDVQVVHDHHFVHGDINDHNLMIDPERIKQGQVRAHLIDFDGIGFTRHDGSITHPRHKGRNIGSSWAPELYHTAVPAGV